MIDNETKEALQEYVVVGNKLNIAMEALRNFLDTFEQNQPEPVVVGLSDEQLKSLHATRYKDYLSLTDFVNNYYQWAKGENFTQPTLQPNWDDAPSWANWLAQDKDGQWLWHAEKPYTRADNWYNEGQSNLVIFKNWKQTLQQRPKPPAPKVKIGQIWQYKGGSKYQIDSVGRMKFEPHTGWVDCVTFMKLEDSEAGAFFTRTLSNFLAKFERVS